MPGIGQDATATGSRATVLQRVRNKNNVAEMYLRRTLEDLDRQLQVTVGQIEMERLDWKTFLTNIRNCNSDDLAEFSHLFKDLYDGTDSSYRGRRTRIKEFFHPSALGIQRTQPNTPHTKAKAQPKSAALPQIKPDLQRALTIPVVKKSELAECGPQRAHTETDLTNQHPSQALMPPINVSPPKKEGLITNYKLRPLVKQEDLSQVLKPPSSAQSSHSSRSSFARIAASMKREFPTIADEDEAVVEGTTDPTSLPLIVTDAVPSTGRGPGPQKEEDASSLMRDILDQNAEKFQPKKRYKRKKPLPLRIKALYERVEELIPKEEQRAWYLPPIDI